MAYWARLREVARWQRSINLAFGGAVALVGVAKGLSSMSGSAAVDSVMGPLSAVAVTAFWVWLIVKLAQALDLNVWLYGMLGIVPLLNFLLLLQLSSRATATLKSAGIGVGFLGTELPEQPPEWFRVRAVSPPSESTTSSPFGPIAKPQPSLLAVWRKRFFRTFLISLPLGVALFGGILAVNPKDSMGLNAVLVVAWIGVFLGVVSFGLYAVVGFLELVIGTGKAVVATTAASLPGGGLKPPK